MLARSRALGAACLTSRRRFLATLPEIAARRAFGKRFGSIFEYGARIGGASRIQVREVLALARRLAPHRSIWSLFETGRVGRSVIERVPLCLIEEDEAVWYAILASGSRRRVELEVAAAMARRERRRHPGAANAYETASGRERKGRAPEPTGGDPASKVDPLGPGGAGSATGARGPDGTGSATGADGHDCEKDPDPIRTRRAPGTDRGDPCGDRAGLSGDGEEPEGDLASPFESRGQPIRPGLGERTRSRLELLRRERSSVRGRKLSLWELLAELVDEEWIETRGAGELVTDETERARLRERALVAAVSTRPGAAAPAALRHFVRARSRGLCEVAGCREPGDHLHHRIGLGVRRSELPPGLRSLPRHHPDACHLLCHAHHEMRHEGRIGNPHAPPGEWVIRAAGDGGRDGSGDAGAGSSRWDQRTTSRIDRIYRLRRRRARSMAVADRAGDGKLTAEGPGP